MSTSADFSYEGSATSGTPPSRNKREHQRTYQACQNCRNSKTKCDRGDVDKPNAGPCARCLREGKECLVAPHRSKKPKVENTEDSGEEERGNNSSRKRARPNSVDHDYASFTKRSSMSSDTVRSPSNDAAIPKVKNEDSDIDSQIPKIFEQRTFRSQNDTLGGLATINSTLNSSLIGHGNYSKLPPVKSSDPVSFDILNQPVLTAQNRYAGAAIPHEVRVAQEGWATFKFVRDGLFTAQEAMHYVSSFYTHMAPLTPVTIPDFKDISTHPRLLKEEPILALTIVTMASRYFLPRSLGSELGPGANSRATEIHNRCWTFLETLISCTLWGRDRMDSFRPFRGLRSYGTVESMLLLTEWHARALHFPPIDGLNLLVSHDQVPNYDNATQRDSAGNPINAWLEPCVRSGRMSWSLLNNAMAIAAELGIFDPDKFSDPQTILSPDNLRAQRLGRLLLIYLESTCLRLGLVMSRPAKPSYVTSFIDKAHTCDEKIAPEEHVLVHYETIGELLAQGSQAIYKNKAHTTQLLENRGYEALVMTYDQKLQEHSEKLKTCVTVPIDQRRILNLEIQFARVHLGSVAIQAIINRLQTGHPSFHQKNGVIAPQVLSDLIEPDRKIIDQLVQASLGFLENVKTFVDKKDFKFIPARSFFRITSVSMILLQCFYMGLKPEHAAKSLEGLKMTCDALQTETCDDVHVSARIGEVLYTLYRRLQSSMRLHPLGPGASNATGVTHNVSATAQNNPLTSHGRPAGHTNSAPAIGDMGIEPAFAALQGIRLYDSQNEPQAYAHVPPPSGSYENLSGWLTAPMEGIMTHGAGASLLDPMLETPESWIHQRGLEGSLDYLGINGGEAFWGNSELF